jgi:RNA polymerase-binding protein DksA
MNYDTTQWFRRQLLADRSALLQRWRQALSDENELLAEREADWEDTATARSGAFVLEQIGQHERHTLARIQSSLARLERGTYDECIACHGPIELERLRVLPYADRCVGCAPLVN